VRVAEVMTVFGYMMRVKEKKGVAKRKMMNY
jgi:hypothetical protein